MEMTREMTRDEVIDALMEHDINQCDSDSVYADVLREGCVGFNNMDDEDLIEGYANCFGETITIKQ